MIVLKYIKQLLYQHDCVVVPGFGAFVSSYAGAEISYVRNKIAPPYKKIAFNEKILSNDHLLENAIQVGEQISPDQVELLLFSWIKQIKQDLALLKQFTLDELGKLYISKEGSLSFEQFTKYNYLSDSFGLPDLYYKPIDRANENTVTFKSLNSKKMVTNSDLYPNSESEDLNENGTTPIEEKDDDTGYDYEEPKRKRSGLALYYVGAAIALLLVVGTSFYLNSDKQGKNLDLSSIFSKIFGSDDAEKGDNKLLPESETATIEEAPADGETFTDESTTSNETPVVVPVAKASSEGALRASVTDAIVSPGNKYYIVAGSFNKVKRAIRYATQLSNDGTPSRLIIPGSISEPVKVTIGTFSSYEEATTKKEELKQTYGPELWVFTY